MGSEQGSKEKEPDQIPKETFWDFIYKVLITTIAFIIAFFIVNGIFIPFVLVNHSPVYASQISIDQYGANDSSVLWDYTVQPERKYCSDQARESWAFFDFDTKNIDNTLDLSDYQGLSFYIKGNIENQKIEFNLFTQEIGENNEYLRYQYYNGGNLVTSSNWKKVRILFSELNITPWSEGSYPSAPRKPDLKKVYAFGFADKINNNTEAMVNNQIMIDEVYLIRKDGTTTLLNDFTGFNATINNRPGLWHTGWGIDPKSYRVNYFLCIPSLPHII
jgi:hypothetical protein